MHIRTTVETTASYGIDPSFNYALSRVFGTSLVKQLDSGGGTYEQNLQNLFRRSGLYHDETAWNLTDSLSQLYQYLLVNYRCEYVYKNEIANQLLLERHSDNSATLLRELASDRSVADIVIVNGKTTAYEIKTELDNFDRLQGQLESYQTLYDEVNVVTHEQALASVVSRLPKWAGILVLDEQAQLHEHRKAESNTHLFDADKAVLTLRQTELVKLIECRFGSLPKIGTASVFNFCRSKYRELTPAEARFAFYEALKSRRPAPHQFQLVLDCDRSLRMMFLGYDLSKRSCTGLRQRLGLG